MTDRLFRRLRDGMGDRALGKLLGRRIQLGQSQPLHQSLRANQCRSRLAAQHPAHRHGVRYSGAGVQQRFGNANLKAGSAGRADLRGREGQQGARPEQCGAGRADQARDRGAGDRGNRARAADPARSGAKSAAKGSGSRTKTADRNRGTAARGVGGRDTAFRNVSAGRAASGALR